MAFSRTPRRPILPDGPRDSRTTRALSEAMAVIPVDDGVYDVVTAADSVYTVDLTTGSCTCPDHRIRNTTCKHLRRVAYEVSNDAVPGPGERVAHCANCTAEFHVDVTRSDPVYCPTCTFSPGEPVRDRETGDVLIVVRSTDRRAAQVGVPGTDHSVAAHPGNETYDPADVIVEAMYPLPAGLDPETVKQRRVRSYSFPRSRLERVV